MTAYFIRIYQFEEIILLHLNIPSLISRKILLLLVVVAVAPMFLLLVLVQ